MSQRLDTISPHLFNIITESKGLKMKRIIEWLDWNDVRNTFPKWLWVMNGVVMGFAILVILFV